MRPSDQEIDNALDEVEAIVVKSNNKLDLHYFRFHRLRYRRMAITIAAKTSVGSSILNIGSHYLHSSLLFKFLGYDVHSMDVGVFWDLDFVRERVETYSLIKIVDDNLESFSSHNNISDRYDIVLFAEIMEHITFNPIHFWKKIHRVIRSEGLIYISTPNSLNLYNIVRTLARLVTMRGVGLPIGSIFANVTYGHHWKEYSRSEIKKYFSMLSGDFHVQTSLYHYRSGDYGSVGSTIFSLISSIGNFLYIFSDEIEALVKVEKSGNWKLESPEY